MNTAENISSARYAVGALALAALAVSAMAFTREPPVERSAPSTVDFSETPREPMTGHARFGAITVVGTPHYERVIRELKPLEDEYSRCAFATGRVTIYAHVDHHDITQLEVLGDDVALAACIEEIVPILGLSVDDNVDLMIPVDLSN